MGSQKAFTPKVESHVRLKKQEISGLPFIGSIV